jgi:hypothetical protein
MDERFDVYMTFGYVDSNDDVGSRWEWRLKTPKLMEFMQEFHELYVKHHPGELFRKPKHLKDLKDYDT